MVIRSKEGNIMQCVYVQSTGFVGTSRITPLTPIWIS